MNEDINKHVDPTMINQPTNETHPMPLACIDSSVSGTKMAHKYSASHRESPPNITYRAQKEDL